MPNQDEVFKVISEERAYQDSLWGDNLDKINGVGDYLVYMQTYLTRAFENHYNTDPTQEGSLDFIRKVTAIGVKAMESFGAPSRKTFRQGA